MTFRTAMTILVATTLCGCSGLAGSPSAVCETPAVTVLADLAARSCRGDRQASYELGLIYETGQDVAQDEKRAARYYAAAATPTSGQTYIYVPAAGKVAGYTMPVTTGTAEPGHAGAQYRLAFMYCEGRGVKQSSRLAKRYLKMAANQGYPATQGEVEERCGFPD